MLQENVEDESMLVSRSPLFNLGLRYAVSEAILAEYAIDPLITMIVEHCINMEEVNETENRLRYMISVRMGIDEGLGYRGGQRLAHEKPYLLGPALDQYAGISWTALRELRLDRTEYGQGFMAGFQDELNGTAQPLPPELPVAFAY